MLHIRRIGGVGLVAGLTRYHTSNPTSWVLNITLTTWNQVNMGVTNSLSALVGRALEADSNAL